jgi:hypothetical protein
MAAQQTEIQPKTRLGRAIVAAMRKHSVSATELAEYADQHLESMRKVIRGDGFPSPAALKLIAKKLDLSFADLNQLFMQDKIEKKWGGLPASMIGKHPEMSLLEHEWDAMRPEQKQTVTMMIKAFAAENLKAIGSEKKTRRSA